MTNQKSPQTFIECLKNKYNDCELKISDCNFCFLKYDTTLKVHGKILQLNVINFYKSYGYKNKIYGETLKWEYHHMFSE